MALYDKGDDYPQAAIKLRKAADLGHFPAQYQLAVMYQEGTGIAANINQAHRWFHESAVHGHTASQYQLAMFYYLGSGGSARFGQVVCVVFYRQFIGIFTLFEPGFGKEFGAHGVNETATGQSRVEALLSMQGPRGKTHARAGFGRAGSMPAIVYAVAHYEDCRIVPFER